MSNSSRETRDEIVDPVGAEPDHAATAPEPETAEATHAGRRAGHTEGPRRGRRARKTGDEGGGRLGTAWVGLLVGALITILLLVFILQNQSKVTTHFLGWEFAMPLGVLMLFAAIAGALIMALFAGFRILQLRMRERNGLRRR